MPNILLDRHPQSCLNSQRGFLPGREDPFCSPGNARLKHSYQRSHFLAKRPPRAHFICLFPLKALGWRGTERECGAAETAPH